MSGYILLKDKTNVPAPRESALTTLRAIVQHARQGEVRGSKVGFAAWEAMLFQLEHDNFADCTLDFPQGVPGEADTWQNSVKGRFFAYCDALCQVHERGVALPYYKTLVQQFPEWSTYLEKAIAAWRECAMYGGFLWKHLTMDDHGLLKFQTPEIRKILADEGRRSAVKDREAIDYIEELLANEAI